MDNDVTGKKQINELFDTWKRLNLYCSSWEQSQSIFQEHFFPIILNIKRKSIKSKKEEKYVKNQSQTIVNQTKKRKFIVDKSDPKFFEPYNPDYPAMDLNPQDKMLKIQTLLSTISTTTFNNLIPSNRVLS